LLEVLGHTVAVHAVDVDESERPGETASAYVERIVASKLRAATVLTASADARVVADTVVDLDGQILHKPTDRADAKRILNLLSGRAHAVTTRFAVATASESHVESVTTRVFFRSITDEEIDAYLATGEADDKAGAYGIQGRAGAFVSRIEGSYGAVVGLPSCEVEVALRRLVR
jgi:septum formation protein